MPIQKSTEYGTIDISLEAVANLAGGTATECYGIVGMASQKLLRDGWAELLRKENYISRCYCPPGREFFDS